MVALDLRAAEVQSALGLPRGPDALLDRTLPRAVALAIRGHGLCQAILVPSMAFIDRPDRHNLIVFCETIAGGLASVLSGPVEVGQVQLWS